jgi:hypothetical protein
VRRPSAASHQLPLQLGGADFPAPVRIAARQNKARHRLPVLQPTLTIHDSRYAPVAGVPRTRADCPTQRPCPHVHCRHHLFLETADHRAGRPGLASVPRDARGLTLPTQGHAGDTRPGTTLRPGWLELERHCKGWIEVDDTGVLAAINVDERMWEGMRLHDGEALRVVSTDGGYATTARVVDGSIALGRAPPFMTVAVLITRVRGVPSCALDEIDRRGKHSNEQTGDAISRHRTLVAREVRRALAKAIKAAAVFGMSRGDLLRGLREIGVSG